MQNIIKNLIKTAVLAALVVAMAPATSEAASPISCPLTAGVNDTIINLPSTILLSNNGTSESSVSANLPAGEYTVTAVTWDDHTGHGGQNQTREQVLFKLFGSNGSLVANTNSTSDIPETSNTRTTNLGTINLNQSVNKITAVHAAKGSSNNYESVTPICIKFNKKTTTPPPPPPSNNLQVSCSVSDTRVEVDEDVTFTAVVSGGNSPFLYQWSGNDNNLSSSNRQFTTEFDDDGSYRATVHVADSSGRVVSDTCPTVVVEEEDEDDELEVSCRLSDSRIEVGDRVTIEVDIDGGEGPFDIEWDRDADDIDNFDDNDRRQTLRIYDEGVYDLRVTVEDDSGDEDSDTCTLRVEDDNGTFISSNPNGNLAGLSSVYLNQVPYTGPEDVAKVLGFISLIAVWSALIAYYALKRHNKTLATKRISAFKEANRLNQVN